MDALRKTALTWLALVVLALLAWRESAPAPTLPRWPAALRVRAPRGGRICASRELQDALRDRAFEFASGPGREDSRWSAPLTLVCAEQEVASSGILGGIELRLPQKGEPLYSDAFAASRAPTRAERLALAEELAGRLAADPAVAARAEDYFLSAQNGLAQAGARAFANEDWSAASRLLFQGLEGLSEPAQAYYGLSVSAAKLGQAQRAWWFALAYLKESGKAADQARLDHLQGLAPGDVLDAEAGGYYAEARRLIERRQLRQAFVVLKLACEKVPWDYRPAEAVAELYDGFGWPQVAGLWRARAQTARVIASERLGLLPGRRVP